MRRINPSDEEENDEESFTMGYLFIITPKY